MVQKQRVGEIIKRARIEHGYTMKEVATRVGVSEAAVSKWESGHTATIRTDKLTNLANMLDLSITALVKAQSREVEKTVSVKRIKVLELIEYANGLTDDEIDKVVQIMEIMKS